MAKKPEDKVAERSDSIRLARTISIALSMLIIVVAGCGGGSSTTSSLTTSPTPTPTSAPMSQVISPGSNNIELDSYFATVELNIPAALSFPSGVSVLALNQSGGSPTPQSSKRKTQSGSARAIWQITFSGATGVGNLSYAPSAIMNTGTLNQASFVIELFDATAGTPPVVFYFNSATTHEYDAAGANFQIALSDVYYLEVVSGSSHGQTTFVYTGASQSFTVPAGMTSLTIQALGASAGGFGGFTNATIPVTPGTVVDVEVGGQPQGSTGGYNGGGAGSDAGGGGA